MSDNDRSPQNSDNQGWFGKFIAFLTAVGGGPGMVALLTGVVALLAYFLGGGGGGGGDSPLSPNSPITVTPAPVTTSPNNPPTLPSVGNQPPGTSGRSASAFCSQFSNPRDSLDCLQAARNCDPSSVIYESCILGEMGHSIVSAPSVEPSAHDVMKEAVQTAFRQLQQGQIAFVAPEQMKVDEPSIIEARLSNDLQIQLTEELQAEFKIKPQSANIKVGSFMKATLEGSDFKIESLASEKQALPEGSVASWRWSVTPTESGRKTLYLTVYARIKLSSNEEEEVYLKSYDQEIDVVANPSSFWRENWKWIIENSDKLGLGFLVSSILAFIGLKSKQIKKLLIRIILTQQKDKTKNKM
jgi:hypothetical protein